MRRATALPLLVLLAACAAPGPEDSGERSEATLIRVAEFPHRQVTGVAVSGTGRIFVNFPLWSDRYEGAVAEVLDDGTLRSYPDAGWNAWRPDTDLDPALHFVCVQSVVVDDEDRLWVLDPASPGFQGPIEGGAKLVQIELDTNRVNRIIPFGPEVVPPGSYLNDVRIDTQRRTAYLTDSGRGALVVVDLEEGKARRVLVDHPSTKAEAIQPTIGGRPLQLPDGRVPQIHSDGIGLDTEGEYLYYHALTGYHLYRIPTAVLRDPEADPAQAVEDLGPDVVCDGMVLDGAGRIYLTALEQDAIARRTPSGELETIIQDPRLRWPDTLAIGPDGNLYVTVSQIHLMPAFNQGQDRVSEPWAVYRLDLGLSGWSE